MDAKIKRADRLEYEIARKAARINITLRSILDDVMKLRSHTKNRIAAHKAHTTMEKKKVRDWDATRPAKKGDVRPSPYSPRAAGRAEAMYRKGMQDAKRTIALTAHDAPGSGVSGKRR